MITGALGLLGACPEPLVMRVHGPAQDTEMRVRVTPRCTRRGGGKLQYSLQLPAPDHVGKCGAMHPDYVAGVFEDRDLLAEALGFRVDDIKVPLQQTFVYRCLVV